MAMDVIKGRERPYFENLQFNLYGNAENTIIGITLIKKAVIAIAKKKKNRGRRRGHFRNKKMILMESGNTRRGRGSWKLEAGSWKGKNHKWKWKSHFRLILFSIFHLLFLSPVTMLSKMLLLSKQNYSGTVPVYLNVYDLTPINGYAYWLGLGVYHSGVQVHGVEYAFGAHEQSTTGIFEVEPKHCPGFAFRKSILIGTTNLGSKDVGSFMEKLAEDYSGNAYHLIANNCNHFCGDVCVRLTGKPIPSWVNRLARLGSLCNCVLPAGLNETKVGDVRLEDKGCQRDKKKLRSQSSRYGSSPDISSLATSVRTSRQRRCLPRSSSLIHSASTSSLALKL